MPFENIKSQEKPKLNNFQLLTINIHGNRVFHLRKLEALFAQNEEAENKIGKLLNSKNPKIQTTSQEYFG